RHGARFDDESLGDEVTVHAAIHQPDAAVFLVYDDAIGAAVSRAALDQIAAGSPGADRIENIRAAGGEILNAPSIEELSLQMEARWGVSRAGLQDTIAAYNAAAGAGTGADLYPPKTGACVPLETAPYYAMHLVVGITFTYGGICIDAQAQALNAAGEPIAGLFVAGADAGGVYTRGYTGGLVLGLAFGRLAGRHAAQHAAPINSEA
ncbi:MAG: FAD-binding protein, partial [Chloroflexota bacterium]|nr:FAD-binding protein [Chloroflexota bacterium]